jgi:AcrR family transcriptional regulator
MEQATLSRRERHKEATRLSIHEAALALTEERGLAAVTVEAIAERADVAPRTFSNYFASKEDALLGLEPDAAGSLVRALAARPPAEAPLAALRAVLIEHMVSKFDPPASGLRRIRVIGGEPQLKARMAGRFDQLTAGLAEGVAERMGVDPGRDIYPALMVTACAGAIRTALLWWSGQDPLPDLRSVLTGVFEQLADGLGRPVGSPAASRGEGR